MCPLVVQTQKACPEDESLSGWAWRNVEQWTHVRSHYCDRELIMVAIMLIALTPDLSLLKSGQDLPDLPRLAWPGVI